MVPFEETVNLTPSSTGLASLELMIAGVSVAWNRVEPETTTPAWTSTVTVADAVPPRPSETV